MNKKQLSALQEDWLANNAVVTFVGALLMAQAWNLPEGGAEISLIITKLTIPTPPEPVYMAFGMLLFGLSFVLAIASIVPRFRCPAIWLSNLFSMALPLLVWSAFTVGWLSAIVEIPLDQWWSSSFIYGGFLMFLFLGYRFATGALSSPPPTEDGSKGTGSESPAN